MFQYEDNEGEGEDESECTPGDINQAKFDALTNDVLNEKEQCLNNNRGAGLVDRHGRFFQTSGCKPIVNGGAVFFFSLSPTI